MSMYIYEAVNKNGETVFNEVNALNSGEVVASLAKIGLIPTKIELKERANSGLSKRSISVFEKFTPLDRIILVRNLAATIKAGLNLNEALDIMIADSAKKIIKEILSSAKVNILNGLSLSVVFEKYDKYFSPLFVGMVKAGELSGQLDDSLEELNHQLAREYKLLKKIKSALAYPVILLFASLGIVVLLLTFVLPKLIKSFEQNHVQLPVLTKALIRLSNAITYSFILDFVLLAGLVGLFLYFKRTRMAKNFFSYMAFHTPFVRNLVKKIILVRFTRTLGSLIASALPISKSLDLTAKAVGNNIYEAALNKINDEIKNGIPLSENLRRFPDLFPVFLVSLVAVGERTGTLEKVLKNFADFYEEDVDSALKDLTTFLEPLMLLFMGMIVGLIAVSILMPLYQMMGKINL